MRKFKLRIIVFTLLMGGLFHCHLYAQKQYILLQSKFLSKPVNVLIVTPEAEVDTKKHPTLILLHGYGADYKAWDKMVDLQSLANEHGFCFVCPDGLFNSWYINSPQVPNSNYYSFLVSGLLPTLSKYTEIDTAQLFIDGYSMGGHGAMYLFLKNSDLFTAAGSISGVLDLQYSAFKSTSLTKLLGPYSEDAWAPYTAINQLASAKTKKPLILSCGTEDRLLISNQIFAFEARKLGYDVTNIESTGAHDKTYWKRAFYLHLIFFKQLCTR